MLRVPNAAYEHLRLQVVIIANLHEVFDYLRAHHPVFWQDMPDEPGYWAVLKHADVVEVARQPNGRLVSAEEVAAAYVLSFYPPNEKRNDGKFHTIRIEGPVGLMLRQSRVGYQSQKAGGTKQ